MAWTSNALSAYWSNAVTKITIGISGIASHTSNPFTRGICTSRKTSSGLSRRMASIACRPLEHSPAISKSGSCWRNCRRRARAGASSSTISTRVFMGQNTFRQVAPRHDDDLWTERLRLRSHRQADADFESAVIDQVEVRFLVVQMHEPRTHVREAD